MRNLMSLHPWLLNATIQDPILTAQIFKIHQKTRLKIPSKEDLDNLFGPLYEEYYETKTLEVSNNSAANTLNNDDTPSSSSIIIEEYEAPQVVSSSEEPIAYESTTPVSNDNADELVLVLEEAKSSSIYYDLSNMHKFYQQHRSTDKWTKNHLVEQVSSGPSKPVMTRSRLHIDAELCMYALTVSTTKAMLDHS
ncbi:hypothetical protein Tco_0527775 [Tanacetum coccineum]